MTAPDETEVWVRNPRVCIRECRETYQRLIVWHEGYVRKASIDPELLMANFYGSQPWRCMQIGLTEAYEFDSEHTLRGNPIGPWPIWRYGEPAAELEMLMQDADRDGGRVIVMDLLSSHNKSGTALLRELASMQRDYPSARMHVSNVTSWRWAFGIGFHSADIEPRYLASRGRIALPNGQLMDYEDAENWEEWIRLLGFRLKDLEEPRNRCIYNILSARWAGRNYRKNVLFKTRGFHKIDPNNPVAPRMSRKKALMRRRQPDEGDYFYCNRCSLADSCRLYRNGSLCAVPGSDGEELVEKFKSRNADDIVDGLGELLGRMADRVVDAMDAERDSEEVHPHVTKMLSDTFDRAEKLAKLLNPNLGTSGSNEPPALTEADKRKLMTAVFAMLEEAGLERSAISPEMVEAVLAIPEDSREAEAKRVAAEHLKALGA